MQFWVQIGETRWRRQAGPAVSERRKRKEKEKEKRKKGAGTRFRFFIKPDKRDPRSATLAHVSRDQAKLGNYSNSAPKRQRDPSTRSETDEWGPLVRVAFSTESSVRGRKKRKGKKEGKGKKPSQLNSSWLQQEWTKPKTME